MESPFYRQSFARHLHSLAISGYFNRGLDADDRQFLEYVKRTGCANGNLPRSNVVLLEELEFWHAPFTIAPGVERRVGKRPRQGETLEQYELRKARSNRWHAQRIIRENERAMAEAELARERREWERAQETRKAREVMTDAEWNAAAPRLHFGKMTGRHFIPQWKLDERGELNDADAKKAKLAAAKLERERLKREAAEIERQRDERIEEYRKQEVQRVIDRENERQATARKIEALDARAVIREARETIARVNELERQWQYGNGESNWSVDTIQKAILTMLNSTPGQVWTADEMMRSVGGCTRKFLDECIDGLVRDGKLRKMEKKP